MRIVLSAGHGLRDPGALNLKLGAIEHLEAYQIAWLLREQLENLGHVVEFISCFQTLSGKIAEVNRLDVAAPVDAAVEIHFNSAADPLAEGTEVLYLGDANVTRASQVSAKLASTLKTRNRGAKKRTNLGWLNQTNCPAFIVEVLFINNPAEAARCASLFFHRDAARAIAAGLTI